MSTYNGKKLRIETFGESHSDVIGARVYGIDKIKIDEAALDEFLARRKPYADFGGTARKEDDIPKFYGINDGFVDGEFSFEIPNNNVKKSDYADLYGKPRPSHADYTAYIKDGTLDFSGGGRFSGRMTAALCVVGGILKRYLESQGVFIAAYLSEVGAIKGYSYKDGVLDYDELIKRRSGFPSLSEKNEMTEEIKKAALDGDSVGGKVECIVYGLKGGLGNDCFDGIEGKISSLVFSVPAVKGVEFGLGFDFACSHGGAVNDELYYDGAVVKFYSNNSGGIYGGITCGEPVTFGVAFKPTPSILKPQRTVDLVNKTNCGITVRGRHDACLAVRAVPCVEAVTAIALYDEIIFEKGK